MNRPWSAYTNHPQGMEALQRQASGSQVPQSAESRTGSRNSETACVTSPSEDQMSSSVEAMAA